MRQDDIKLNEAYSRVHQEVVEEDLGALVKAGATGLGNRITGAGKKLGANISKGYHGAKQGLVSAVIGDKDAKNTETYKQSQAKINAANQTIRNTDAQTKASIINSYVNTAVPNMVRDIKTFLSLNIADENVFKQDILNAIKKNLTAGGELKGTSGMTAVGVPNTKIGLK